jgi:hypothetical protein
VLFAPVAVVSVVAPSMIWFFVSLKESKLQLKLESVADDEGKKRKRTRSESSTCTFQFSFTSFSIEAVKCGVPKTVRLKP